MLRLFQIKTSDQREKCQSQRSARLLLLLPPLRHRVAHHLLRLRAPFTTRAAASPRRCRPLLPRRRLPRRRGIVVVSITTVVGFAITL